MISDVSDTTRVLVCVITRLADLELARTQGWYRIPLAHTPQGLAANYLAFYQTAAFGEQRWAIRWYAPVCAITLARRVELLPEEPGHRRASTQYYRFALGPLEQLPQPIPSRRVRRVTFIATTLAQLYRAQDVAELWHPAEQHMPAEVWGAGIGRRSLRK